MPIIVRGRKGVQEDASDECEALDRHDPCEEEKNDDI